MHRTARLLLLAVPAIAATTACHRKRPAPVTPEPAVSVTDDADRARREAEAREAARRAEEARLRAEREAAERARAARETLEASVYFAFDRSDLDATARRVLDAKVPVLQTNGDVRVRVAGHTDDRGSDEYNLALGARRAAAAKRYLSQQGIDEGRMEVVSLGEERPTCSESTEACWSQNRRAAFEVTGGTIAGRSPAGGGHGGR